MAKRSAGSVIAVMAAATIVAAVGSLFVGALAFNGTVQTYDGTTEVVVLLGIMGVAFVGIWLVALGAILGLSE